MAKKPYLECGQIVNTHGVRGAVRVISYCDTPEVLASLDTVYRRVGDAYKPFRVLDAGLHKQFVLMTLEGVADMDAAIRLKGVTLYAAREDIPTEEGTVFVADLLGLTVYDADTGRVYGTLRDLQSAPASDIYEIETPDGETVLFPAVPEFLDRADPDEGIFIRPIPGFFADEEGADEI